ncbi:MAG TPA: glycosyltransferase [Planctomycetes bacterium]|nr:glycosyltransferase [Planctomycetota bacterium]
MEEEGTHFSFENQFLLGLAHVDSGPCSEENRIPQDVDTRELSDRWVVGDESKVLTRVSMGRPPSKSPVRGKDARMSEDSLRVLSILTRMNRGGPSRMLRLADVYLRGEGVDHRLLCGQTSPGEDEPAFAKDLPWRRVSTLRREIRPFQDVKCLREVTRHIRDFRPHVVHTHMGKAGWVGRLAAARAGVPAIVHTFHGHTFRGYWGPVRNRILLSAERYLARRSDALIALSPSQSAELGQLLGQAAEAKIRVMPVPLDPEAAPDLAPTKNACRQALGLDAALVIGFVGRLAPVKDVPGFLRVFRRILSGTRRPVTALIAGRGDDALERRLHDQVDALGLQGRVRWLGAVDDVTSVYRACDVLVLTSRNEGSPLALLEGAALGVPVAAYAVGGVEDLLGTGPHAAYAPPGDEESLTNLVLKWIDTGFPTAVQTARAAARLRGLHDAQRVISQRLDLYRELVRTGTTRRGGRGTR